MKIVVNDIAASTGGAMTVLRDFYAYICENDRENEWIFLLSDRFFQETDNVKIKTLPEIKQSRLKKLVFDFITGRKYINALAPDVVFSLQNCITFGVKAPQIVYIHQSIPFQTQKKFSFLKSSERSLSVIQHLIGSVIKLSAKKADRVIVQTQWMRKSVCQICRLKHEKVRVIQPAVKPVPTTAEKCSFSPLEFFYPTAQAIYKNNDCIRKASEMLRRKGLEHRVTLTLPADQTEGSVVCAGRLSYEEVLARYCQGTLIFPSYIETFGYPLAEARMAGTVVLASDTPFSREVLAGYENAYFFDPFKPEELAGLMERVINGDIQIKETDPAHGAENESWKQVMETVLHCRK